MPKLILKMNRHLILFAIVFFLNISFLIAQPLHVEWLNTMDGLSNNQVHYIFQDSYGLLWIGTEYGLNLYDGYSFKVFKNEPGNPESIISNVVRWVVEDAENNLWIGTGEGVSKYIRKEDKFKNYDLYGDYYSTAITYIDSKGRIWAGVETENILKYNKENDSWDEQEYVLIDSSRNYSNPRIVFSITEDINKKLWMASIRHGIMWYDENKKVFKQSEVMNKSEAYDFTSWENFITSLYSDSSGVLWITTRNGVYKYNPALKKFETIKKYTTDKLNEWSAYNCITQDEEGNVWIANTFNGLLQFEGISDEFNRIEISGQNSSRDGRSDIDLTRILCDGTGILWIGTITKGVIKYDPNKKLFAHYKHNEKDKNSVSSSDIYSLLESKVHPGKVYVGTRGGGLNLFDTQAQSFSTIPFDIFRDRYGGSVRSILEEEDGSLWLGTWGDGLLKMDPQMNVVRRFCPDSTNIDCLSDARVRIIRKDSSGNLWIGTSGGLNYMDLSAKKITGFNREYLSYSQELIDMIKNNISLDLDKAKIDKVGDSQNLSDEFEAHHPGNYLIITAGEGNFGDSLMFDYGWIVDSKENIVWSSDNIESTYHIGGAGKNRVKIETLQLNPGKYTLKYKSDNSHCFGKWNADPPMEPEFWGIRILEINNQSELDRIQKYLDDIRKKLIIRGSDILAIHLSKNNIVWVGTNQYGLHKINKNANSVKTYLLNNGDKNSLSDISINDIYEDNKGILWLATNRGLIEFDPVKETFTTFNEEDGLPASFIASILPGDDKELWLSTINGISKMIKNESTGKATFANFGLDDGLGGMNFTSLAALKTNDGKYFFGGSHGLNEFTLKSSISTPPKLVLTDLKISNKSVLSMKAEILQGKSIYDLKNLSLSYSQNDLSFEFAALHFSNPQKNKYAHKLEGYEDDWIYDNRRIATYTNLDPGEYTFKFKGSNRDGIWNEESKSIAIIISPPFWQTWWAYTIYVIGFVGILGGIRRYDLNRRQEKESRRILELENERKTKELEQARRLQLSMLPEKIPYLPNLDIAVHMKTATEVGGDYYDFYKSDENVLNIVVGDATGHGLDAGMMVSISKGLFQNLVTQHNLSDAVSKFNHSLISMKLSPMLMSLFFLRIYENQLQVTGAGMPPLLAYQSKVNRLIEVESSGPPLGAFSNLNYEINNYELSTGDIIVLMSDGFAERMNENKEIFGWDKGKELLAGMNGLSADQIVKEFVKTSDQWGGERPQDDDITFVAIKVK